MTNFILNLSELYLSTNNRLLQAEWIVETNSGMQPRNIKKHDIKT